MNTSDDKSDKTKSSRATVRKALREERAALKQLKIRMANGESLSEDIEACKGQIELLFKELKAIDGEEEFSSFASKLEVLWKHKNKEVQASFNEEIQKCIDDEVAKRVANASTEEVEVEEGYKPIDRDKENKMYRRAGNLARTSLSSKGKKKLDSASKSAKIVSAISRQKENERFDKMADVKARSNYNEEVVQSILEKCWKGYEKKGMKTMFGKRYPNCVKKKATRKEEFELDERTRYAKETGKDPQTGKPSVKGGEKPSGAFAAVTKELRKSGGLMSSRKKAIQPQGKKKVPGAKGLKGATPVDKIKAKLAQQRAPKPNPYKPRAGESD